MGIDDVCPYQIVSDQALGFNSRVSLKINQAQNVDVYLLTGTSLDAVDTQQQLATGSTVTFDSSLIGFLILRANYNDPLVSFSFYSQQTITTPVWIGIVIGSAVGYLIILIVSIVLIARHMT